VPAASTGLDPLNCVALLPIKALLAIEQLEIVHPGPLKRTTALLGSNPVPVIVKVKDCPPTSWLGEVVIALT